MSRIPLVAPKLSLIALSLTALFATGLARADTLPVQSTYTFLGQCTDCAGTASALLVLQNYNLGDQIGDTNFVSFTYLGTDLVNPYTVTMADMPYLYGAIDPTLPSAETVGISDDAVQFISSSAGFWCTGPAFSCSLDFGQTHQWSAAVATPGTSVPEPMTLGLLGAGLLGLATIRRRA